MSEQRELLEKLRTADPLESLRLSERLLALARKSRASAREPRHTSIAENALTALGQDPVVNVEEIIERFRSIPREYAKNQVARGSRDDPKSQTTRGHAPDLAADPSSSEEDDSIALDESSPPMKDK